MRVVYCIDTMAVGGTEMNAVRTAERLDRSRFAVTVACLDDSGPLAARYRDAGIEVVPFPISSLYGADALRAGIRLARFLAERRADIVHSHDMYSNVFAAPWARLARTPVVISSRRWWHTLPNRKLQLGNRIAFRLSHCVLANSPRVAESVHTADGVRSQRVRVVSNFADDEAFEPMRPDRAAELRRALGVAPDSLVVGTVARLVPVKDHASLLRAAARLRGAHPNLTVLLVGDGPSRGELAALARTLGIEDMVVFAGERLGGGNYHHAFDVSVLCSLSEGFPNAIVEAMAAARPVVATAVGGSVDAVDDGVTGLLVPPSDPEALAAAVGRLLVSPQLRASFGAAGRERARSHYAASSVLATLEALYDDLLARRTA